MIANYNMIVDFARPQKSNTVIVAENDIDSRKCNFKLLFDKAPFDMTGVVQATVMGIKGDQSYVYAPADIAEDDQGNKINLISWIIPGTITEDAGTVACTITLADGVGASITSFEFYIKVRNALYNEDDFVDDDDRQGFRDLLARCQQALERMEQMVQHDALPNPYPLRFTVDNVEYEYNGEETITILMEEVAYLGAISGTVEITEDDSAAAVAIAAAEAAAESEENASTSEQNAARSLQSMIDLTDHFQDQIPTATVTKSGHIATITITDRNGTSTVTIDDGRVGNKWYKGVAISGGSAQPQTYQTGIVEAYEGDFYLNPSEGMVYVCVVGGDESTATWKYELSLSGSSGGGEWGSILGTLSDQTDLQDALDAKMSYADNGFLGAKNLLDVSSINTQTINDVTFTMNSDGTINVNGTAAANTFLDIPFTLPVGSFTLTGCPSGGGYANYIAKITDLNGAAITGIGDDTGSGSTFTNSTEQEIRYVIRIANGYAASNVLFRPMLRLASDTDNTYAPYAKTNKELTSDINTLESYTDTIVRDSNNNVQEFVSTKVWTLEVATFTNVTRNWYYQLACMPPSGSSHYGDSLSVIIDHFEFVANANSTTGYDVKYYVACNMIGTRFRLIQYNNKK